MILGHFMKPEQQIIYKANHQGMVLQEVDVLDLLSRISAFFNEHCRTYHFCAHPIMDEVKEIVEVNRP